MEILAMGNGLDRVVVNSDGTTILSDEELKSVTDTLTDNRNVIDELAEKINEQCENEDNSNAPLEEGEAEYVQDGLLMPTEKSKVLEFNHFENIDSSIDNIINDNLKENLATNYDFSDEEVIKFANLITKIRAKEPVKIYENLPETLKTHIDSMVNEQDVPIKDRPKVLEFTAKLIIDELINDAELDNLAIDMEQAMKELVPAPLEIYSEFNRDYIENEFLKVAEKVKDENPRTAENLLAMRRGYIDAYTYESMYEVFNNPKIQKNIRRSEVLWSRTNTEYLRLAKVCKFKLQSLDTIYNALIKLNFLDYQAKRLITLFVYTYTNGVKDYNSEEEYNDIYRNSFANYFEGNIINLSMMNNMFSEFSEQVRDSLVELCDHIDSTIYAKEEELSNKKKKK